MRLLEVALAITATLLSLPVVESSAYGVQCNQVSQWGLSGWFEDGAVPGQDPEDVDDGFTGAQDCIGLLDENENPETVHTIAYQGCGRFVIQVYDNPDCLADTTHSFANYGPAFVPSQAATPPFQSYQVFDGYPPTRKGRRAVNLTMEA